MAIYPDKKDGKLTGRFRVELQHKAFGRYRKRFDTHKEAVEAEQSVMASWAAGEAHQGTSASPRAPEAHSIANVSEKAQGQLWRGDAGERSAWAHIRTVGEILGADTRLDDITTLKVDEVAAALRRMKKSDATINRYLSHLRTFLNWAKARGYRTVEVKEIDFSWRKESPGRIRWITPAEERKLQKHLPEHIWYLVKIGIETGCRRGELLNVERDQISIQYDDEGKIVRARLHLWKTKTDSPRTVPMGPETTRMLLHLIDNKLMPHWFMLRYHWNRAKEKMNLTHDDEFVFHTTRHTRATRMLDQGVDVLIIKEWLGHKRIETTQRYTHVKPRNLEAALEAVGGF